QLAITRRQPKVFGPQVGCGGNRQGARGGGQSAHEAPARNPVLGHSGTPPDGRSFSRIPTVCAADSDGANQDWELGTENRELGTGKPMAVSSPVPSPVL